MNDYYNVKITWDNFITEIQEEINEKQLAIIFNAFKKKAIIKIEYLD